MEDRTCGLWPSTVNFAYNDTRRGIRKCPYSRSVLTPEVSFFVLQLDHQLRCDFALGMEILLFSKFTVVQC